ncbi:MAG TPA: hypothetical protein VLT91_10325 [Rhizomicrobium sp.]|nr:hypothetical protein [Rhizomicrobium sp.]
MKHATAAALDRLEALLRDLRKTNGLKEKSRGVFYRGGRAFLHFHEHGALLFADVRFHDAFDRRPVTTRSEQLALLRKVRAVTRTAKKNAK